MKVSRGLLAGVMVTLAVPVCAQSLGDLAKKEQERRKATPPASKVYTNDDLKKIYVPGAVTAPSASDQAGKPGDKDAAAKGDDASKADAAKTGDAAKDKAEPKMGEAEWRARMTGARESLRRSEMFRDALQTRINSLTADFTARDDPYQRALIADDRQKALAELAAVNKEIDAAKKTITDIEEEARRANVPAGWIR
jgi:hypothetical protein